MYMGGKLQPYECKWSMIFFPWATIVIYLYLAFGKFNRKLCTLQWNWQIVFGFKSMFLVKDECTTMCSIIAYLIVWSIILFYIYVPSPLCAS